MADRTSTPATSGEAYYWRSVEALAPTKEYIDKVTREFPPGASELEVPPLSRRNFLGAMSASLAMAGVTASGCIRKPNEKIMPYARRPEFLVPGKPRHYATSALIGGSVLGLIVESQDGRPTKVEGNPDHPMSYGATSSWAQASVLDLYDPDRSRLPLAKGEEAPKEAGSKAAKQAWAKFDAFLDAHLAELDKTKGKGLALLIQWRPSTTYEYLLAQLKRRYPQLKVFVSDAAYPAHAAEAARMLGLGSTWPLYHLSKARVVLSLDADFLGGESEPVHNAREFAQARRLEKPEDSMNRLYAVGPTLSSTTMAADHRLGLKASEVGSFLKTLAHHLFTEVGLAVPAGAEAAIAALKPDARYSRWAAVVARDLASNRGESAIVVGERQPAWVHALGYLLSSALGNVGKTMRFDPYPLPDREVNGLAELAKAITSKQVTTLVTLGANPVYEAASDLKLGPAIAQVPVSIHHGTVRDETAGVSSWHVPASHYLEAWGDWIAEDGTVSIQQPLIAPLYQTTSEIELLARLAGLEDSSGYNLVRHVWSKGEPTSPRFERAWRRWLHDGLIKDFGDAAKAPARAMDWRLLGSAITKAKTYAAGLEINFQLDNKVYDGRWANNAWLQELPDPITKLTWDNAALIGPKTAGRLGVKNEDLVLISNGDANLEIPVWVTPGVVDDCVVIPLGYGRTSAGSVGNSVGFNGHRIRHSASPLIAAGVTIKKTPGQYKLASTQDYGQMVEPTLAGFKGRDRKLVREATLEGYRKNPKFPLDDELLPPGKIKSTLFKESHEWLDEDKPKLPQWGMSIDLTACLGCSACVVACQAENNIPVVGKDRVADGREMHWLRIDRYFTGDMDAPRAVTQPVACQQCENAPCETVCPVAATAHSPEGLNDMAYNRCIGTRYCSNNCPYKVRRFNFFNYNKENDTENPKLPMQRNPDVTVRFRGVMEKCTYCVQRISKARIAAKRRGDGVIKDGAITPACAQTCPTEAIVFGDISDPNSRVAKLRERDRSYGLLADLNTKPRTTYLAKIRNPNPELG